MASIRFHLAVIAAKLTARLIHMLGRKGSHNPGVVALKLCPDFLAVMPKPRLTICVTGTNGKTTVSNMLTDALTDAGLKAVSNRTGSNIVPGCVTNGVNSLNWLGKPRVDAAVYEVDERASRLILPGLKPDYLVVTNLFRDSLKRNAHPDYIFSVIDTYCPDTTRLILNADDLCSSRLKPNSERVFYGIGKQEGDLTEPINLVSDYSLCPRCGEKLRYDYLRYHHIGHAVCPGCGFHSMDADLLVSKIDKEGMELVIEHQGSQECYPLISDITFNIYNELTVIAALRQIGYSAQETRSIVEQIKVPDSRLNREEKGGVAVVQAMSKGQSCVSSCRTFDYVSSQPGKKAVVLAMDDAYDRKKSVEYVGWIYDVDYEFLAREGVEQVVCTGPRCLDHRVRLLLAGVAPERIVTAMDELSGMELVDIRNVDTVYILYDTSTYSLSCRMKQRLLERLEAEK